MLKEEEFSSDLIICWSKVFIDASNWFGWWEFFCLFCFLCLFSLSFASLLFSDYSSSLISIMRPLPLFKDFSMMFRSTLKLNCMHVYYIYFKAIKSAKLILTALWLFRYFYPEFFFYIFWYQVEFSKLPLTSSSVTSSLLLQ